MSFADNREGWTNVAGVVASLVAAYFTFGASTAAETAIGAAAAEAGVGGGAAAGEAAYAASIASSTIATTASATSYATYAAMASSALSGLGGITSALNQQGSAEYNAAMGRSNAEMASMQAGAAEEAQRRKAELLLGEQRAAFVQSGVDPSSGTGLLVQNQSARNAEMDALNVRYQGLLQGRGLLAQSQLDTRQAAIYGQNATLTGVNAALSTYGAYQAGKGRYLKQGNYSGAGYSSMYGGG